MDTKINIYILSIFLKQHNFLIISISGNNSFGRTYILLQMFIFLSTRDLQDASADWREILHGDQY